MNYLLASPPLRKLSDTNLYQRPLQIRSEKYERRNQVHVGYTVQAFLATCKKGLKARMDLRHTQNIEVSLVYVFIRVRVWVVGC